MKPESLTTQLNNYRLLVEGSGFRLALTSGTEKIGFFTTLHFEKTSAENLREQTISALEKALIENSILSEITGKSVCKIVWWEEFLDFENTPEKIGFTMFPETFLHRQKLYAQFWYAQLRGHANFFCINAVSRAS
jgi:hypothetical protein